jgi:hypothetical protein
VLEKNHVLWKNSHPRNKSKKVAENQNGILKKNLAKFQSKHNLASF